MAYTLAVHRNKTITTTQEEILGSNPQRHYALIQNDSDSVMYLGLGVPAVANQGIRLNASGGYFEITSMNPFHGRIYAISTAATKKLMLTEY